MQTEDDQIKMFGDTIEGLKAMVSESISDPSMLAMGLLSDSQEAMLRGHHETARRLINASKWIIQSYLRPPREAR